MLFEVMRRLFGRAYASGVVNACLAYNSFEVPFCPECYSHPVEQGGADKEKQLPEGKT